MTILAESRNPRDFCIFQEQLASNLATFPCAFGDQRERMYRSLAVPVSVSADEALCHCHLVGGGLELGGFSQEQNRVETITTLRQTFSLVKKLTMLPVKQLTTLFNYIVKMTTENCYYVHKNE